MHFPKFWAQKSAEGISCWGWSDRSVADAEEQALIKTKKIAERRIVADLSPTKRDSYDSYGERPLREPVLEGDGTEFAITRNTYGALVLNAARVVFVDVDIQPPAAEGQGGLFSWLKKLLGQKPESVSSSVSYSISGEVFSAEKMPSRADSITTDFITKVRRYIAAHPRWGISVYQTAGGYRLLITHDEFEPEDSAVEALFDYFDCDPRYRKLCRSQKSFRARLTPKPWRCRMMQPDIRWPFADAKQETLFQGWLKKYEKNCENFATCRLLGRFGNERIDRNILAVREKHDLLAKVESSLPLA